MGVPRAVMELREKILLERSLIWDHSKPNVDVLRMPLRLDWTVDPANPASDKRLTPMMRALVTIMGMPIEEILSNKRTGMDIEIQTGVDYSTVSKWRKRLGIPGERDLKYNGK